MPRTALLSLVAGLALTASAPGRDDLLQRMLGDDCAACKALAPVRPQGPFDPATGRDTRNYAPNPGVDFRHMKLDVTIADMDNPLLAGIQTLSVVPAAKPCGELSLDARLLSIKRVTVDGHITRFNHDGQRLHLYFDPPLPVGEVTDIVTTYETFDPPRGLIWTPTSPAWPGRPPQIHSQGQPETNSYWFPCHDFPNDRLTTELLVTVPDGFIVSSNGHLVETTNRILERKTALSTDLAPYTQFHWLQDKPHVNYLVSMVVGRFDVVTLPGGPVPVEVYAPLGRGADARTTFGRTPRMIDFFSTLLDTPYPWDRYAQLVVWNFGSGGMENTSCTTLHDNTMIEPAAAMDYDQDGLISHELAHQWFGDLVTCNTWEHTWLNEGWATFMTPLWLEHREGRNDYLLAVKGNFDAVAANDKGEAPDTPGMASKLYSDPWQPFRRGANPYSKGSSILAMLRSKLGDRAFFKGTANYLHKFGYRTVETADFRKALEDASGQNLELFFQQWTARPNIPRVTLKASWDQSGNVLRLEGTQTQTVNGLNPTFEFTLPIWVCEPNGPTEGQRVNLEFHGRTATATASLLSEPHCLAIDPEVTVLCDVTCDYPGAKSIQLAMNGPTIIARLQGIKGLGGRKDDTALRFLRDTALDTTLHTALRVAAVNSLKVSGDWGDISALATGGVTTWEVREAVASAMGELAAPQSDPAVDNGVDRSRALEQLTLLANTDRSTRVRAAAIRALGTMKAGAAYATITKAMNVQSQNDDIRLAALSALASLDRKTGLGPVVALTKEGVNSRTRPSAIETLVKLAHHDTTLAFETIAPLVDDHEWRTRQAALQAMVDLNDPRCESILKRRSETARDPYERDLASQKLTDLQAKLKK